MGNVEPLHGSTLLEFCRSSSNDCRGKEGRDNRKFHDGLVYSDLLLVSKAEIIRIQRCDRRMKLTLGQDEGRLTVVK
jgi:hypothetical protein